MEHIAVISIGTSEYCEKHSRFLGFVLPCADEGQAASLIAENRKKYWDARHLVYAYVLADGTARFSDDGEPHGTAGKPVLEVLQSSGLKNAIVMVIRYFGGILLGTGGLVRAYTAAAKQAIDDCGKAKIIAGDVFSISVDYADYDKLNFLLKEFGADIRNSDFSDRVSLLFAVSDNKKDDCLLKIEDVFSSSVKPEFREKTEICEKI